MCSPAWKELPREEQEVLNLKDMFRHWTWLERFKSILSTEWMVEKRKQLVLRACNRASEVRAQRMSRH